MSLSLRSFHLFFIAVSVLLAAWIGVWGVQNWLATKSLGDLALGVLAFLAGLGLVAYGLKARRKLRTLDPDD